MAQETLDSARTLQPADTEWNWLCRAGAIAALLQLVCLLSTIGLFATVGAEPVTVEEYFSALNSDRITGLFRLDFPTLILISLFFVTAFGIYAALHDTHQAFAGFATAMVIVGMILALAPHSAFSMITLADRFAAATTEVEKAQLLTAGAAVLASDMWHSTSGFLAGIFMQGGFVIISIVMLKNTGFSKWTAYTGLAANGLDLIHIFVNFISPSLATILLSIGGIFYLVWFPLLARDLYRLGSSRSTKVVQG